MTRLSSTLAAVLLCAATALLVCPRAAHAQRAPDAASAPSPQDKAKAMKSFRKGRAAFAAGRYEEALAALRESYQLVPSPNSHLMIVHALTELGRNVEAYQEAQAVAAEADAAAGDNPKYAKTATAAREEMDRLKGTIGLVTVEVAGVGDPAQATLTVAGRTLPPDQWSQPLPVEPGSVHVELTAPNGTATRDVEVAAGGQAIVSIEPPKPEGTRTDEPPPPPPKPVEPDEDEGADLATPAYWALGIGGVGMLSFMVFGVLTQNEFSELEERCPANNCAPSLDEEADAGRAYQTVANVSLVVGLVGVSAGAALLIVHLTGESDEAESADERRPSVAIGPGSVVVSGTF